MSVSIHKEMKKFVIPSEEDFAKNTNTVFRQERSYNGYSVGDLKSWLQKAIRRGSEDEAVWAAVELYTLPKQSVVTNLFNRLRIISMEDIGVANPSAVKCVGEILASLETAKGKPKLPVTAEGVMKVAKLTAYLAKSKHLRLCSDYKAVFMTPSLRPKLKKIFPSIYTKHHEDILGIDTSDAKILGSRMINLLKEKDDCAFYVMAKIMDLEVLPFKTLKSQKPAYYVLDLIDRLSKELKVKFSPEVKILVGWMKGGIINSKIDYNLPLYYALLMILKRDDMSSCDLDCAKDKVVISNFLPKVKILKIPSYALDKHTLTGKKAGKTAEDFANEGALVENEDANLLNPEYREVYLRSKTVTIENAPKKVTKSKKRISKKVVKTFPITQKTPPKKSKKDSTPLESEIIEFDVRIQVTVADSRSDTYFGIEKETGRRVFIKGPYKDKDAASLPAKIYEIKKLLDPNLPSIRLELKNMKPDLFPAVPWGFRRHTDRTKGYWFLIADNIFTVDPIPRKIHNTKMWKDEEIVDWTKIKEPEIPNPLKLKGKALDNYILNILFRFVLGIPDPADRNFMLMKDGRVFSVDEEGINFETNYPNALKEKRCTIIKKYVNSESGWKTIHSRTKKWLKSYQDNVKNIENLLGESSEWLLKRLRVLQDQKKTYNIF